MSQRPRAVFAPAIQRHEAAPPRLVVNAGKATEAPGARTRRRQVAAPARVATTVNTLSFPWYVTPARRWSVARVACALTEVVWGVVRA